MRESLPRKRKSMLLVSFLYTALPLQNAVLHITDPNLVMLTTFQGMLDEIFPIDDYILCLQHGPPKQARYEFHAF